MDFGRVRSGSARKIRAIDNSVADLVGRRAEIIHGRKCAAEL